MAEPSAARADTNVTLGIGSFNTRRATELAIRSVRATTRPGQLALWVGDSGSSDGSIQMLEGLRQAGLIDRLDVVPEGRSHGQWIDFWRRTTSAPLLAVADSDVELLENGWLERMSDSLTTTGAGLVSVGAYGEGSYTQRDTFTMRTVARPEMYLVLVDQVRTASIDESFDFSIEEQADGTWLAWDTGARFSAELVSQGIGWTTMPDDFKRVVRHWGALSYILEPRRLPSDRLRRVLVYLRRGRTELRVASRLSAARRRQRRR